MDDVLETPAMSLWRSIAMRYPEVEETGVCVRIAFKARGRNFFFMGAKPNEHNALLKLTRCLPEAEALAAESPGHYAVGKHGWVSVKMPRDQAPSEALMTRWIDDTFRTCAPKSLVRSLPPAG